MGDGGNSMAPKSSFWWGLWLCIAFLAACTPEAVTPPTADQKTIRTAVAATLNAASTATQGALPTSLPTQTKASTPEPTQPIPTTPAPVQPSPTAAIPTATPQRIAYTKNSDVYLWTSGLEPARLTDLHDVVSVRLSSDGMLIAFKRQHPEDVTLQELWVVNTEGIPNPRVLISVADFKAIMPSDPGQSILGTGISEYTWRPNTHTIAYSTVILSEGLGLGLNHDLRLVDADTFQKTTLLAVGEGGLFYYSPNGSQIALSNPQSISLVNADGSNLQKDVLTFPDVMTYSEYAYHPHPTWADDSLSLGVAIPPHDPMANPLPPTALWSIPSDGSPPTLLSQVAAMPFYWPDNAFASDLKHVIYVTQVGAPASNQRELHLAKPDGSNDVIYDQGESLQFLSWSPDSNHFIYQVISGAKKGVYMGGLVSQPKLVIFDPGVVANIKWFGSNRLVFPFKDGSEWQLFIQNPDSGELTRLDTIPDSSPDFDVLP
jgi:hypothetical protein